MSHFSTLFEHAMSRLNHGGIVVLDYVKIVKNMKDDVSPTYKNDFEEFQKCDRNLKVLEIVSGETNRGGKPSSFSCVVGIETASGIFSKKITIPAEYLEVIGYNIPPSIPDDWKYKSKEDRDGDPEVLVKSGDEFAVTTPKKTKDLEFKKL